MGIVEIKGCFFLKALLPDEFNIDEALRSSFDQTDIECQINHIHLDEYIKQLERNIKTLVEQGVNYAFALKALLPETKDFNVIFACTHDPLTDCNVRFHKRRVDQKWLTDDIESYEEALFVI
jgi:hypothetical protein